MAPEQTLAGAIDARTDIYAMGVVLFEMVTGQRPFSADDTAGVLDAHRNQPPPHLADVAPSIAAPRGLDRVIQRALAKDPDDRYQTAVEMAAALEAVTEGQRAQTAPTAGSAARRPTWSVAMFALVLLGAAIAAYVMIGRRDGGTATHASGSAATTPAAGPATAFGAVDAAAIVQHGAADAAAAAAALAGLGSDAAIAAIAAPDASLAIEADAVAVAVEGLDAAGPDAYQGEIDMAVEEVAAADPNEIAPAQVQPDDDDGEAVPPVAPPTVQPTPVAPATSIAEALAMAKRGQREPAIDGLRALWKKHPRDGRYPYALANLYFEKRWWTVALTHYGAAVKQARGYRGSGVMIRNVIQMLGHRKTRGKAWWFLDRVVGNSARPYLKVAAKKNPKPQIRSAARGLLK
jgi:serine/threonine-protein kinase